MYLFHFSATLAMVAVWACSHNICPDVLPAHVARHDMIHGQSAFSLAAILAGIIVAAKDLAAGQLDVGARSVNLDLQPNH